MIYFKIKQHIQFCTMQDLRNGLCYSILDCLGQVVSQVWKFGHWMRSWIAAAHSSYLKTYSIVRWYPMYEMEAWTLNEKLNHSNTLFILDHLQSLVRCYPRYGSLEIGWETASQQHTLYTWQCKSMVRWYPRYGSLDIGWGAGSQQHTLYTWQCKSMVRWYPRYGSLDIGWEAASQQHTLHTWQPTVFGQPYMNWVCY